MYWIGINGRFPWAWLGSSISAAWEWHEGIEDARILPQPNLSPIPFPAYPERGSIAPVTSCDGDRTGSWTIAGVPIDINTVATPSYIQAGKEDHIAPAKSVYEITRHFSGPMRFLLAGSGHIAGVVNPPAAMKYNHWTNEKLPATLEDFVAGATEHKGSWWPDWISWLAPQSGKMVPARQPANAIEDAPGSYVKERI